MTSFNKKNKRINFLLNQPQIKLRLVHPNPEPRKMTSADRAFAILAFGTLFAAFLIDGAFFKFPVSNRWGLESMSTAAASQAPMRARRIPSSLDGIEAELRERFRGASPFGRAQVMREKSAIQITLKSDSVFRVGSAEMKRRFEPGFREFTTWLSSKMEKNSEPSGSIDIQIESHTDHYPIVKHRYLFKTNWELSAARAAAITSLFEQSKIPMSRLQATAFADSRPLGKDPASNRRIVIRLSAEEGGS